MATESRNEEPGESVWDAAIAAPPPATARPATVAARIFFEVSFGIGESFRSLFPTMEPSGPKGNLRRP